MSRAFPRTVRGALATVLTVAAGAVVTTALATVTRPTQAAAAAAETIVLPASGAVTVEGHGNGHGHGMAQYGARGAAIAGRTAQQIAAFYYPHTTLTTLPASVIRVQISGALGGTQVRSVADMTVVSASGATLVASLPTSGTSRYRLVASGTGLRAESLTNGAWRLVKDGLPAQAFFRSTAGYVRLYRGDGSTDYRGVVGGVRSGSGTVTVNRVALDSYTMGVVPREMPASWQIEAVRAQAIAARSYGRQAVETHTASAWDICDSTQCQVYGGMTHYDTAGNVLWTDYPPAVVGNENTVVRYNGVTAFTQFSASDGGWTADGGQPYLIAQADPYDNTASGDPYLNWSYQVPVSRIAGYYGLARATTVEITARDGNGQWGGRVQYAYVSGVDGSGTTRRIGTTGFGLEAAMGVPTEWFHFPVTVQVPGAPTGLTATASDAGGWVTWVAPASNGGSAVTGYSLTFGTSRIMTGPAVRRAWVGPLKNGVPATVAVRAINAVGEGPPASIGLTPTAAPLPVTALAPARLFDTRSPRVTVDSTHPYAIWVTGRAGIPADAKAVQLALTILHPSTSGTIRVHTSGTAPGTTSIVSYPAGIMTTTSLTLPLLSSTKVIFEVSAGSVELLADVMGYSRADGSMVAATNPALLASIASTPTGNGVAVPVRAVAGADATAVLLRVNGTSATTSGWLRVWSQGAPPTVNQVAVTRYSANANTVLVPVTPDGTVRVAASSAGIATQVTLLGVLGPAAAGRGALETYQVSGVADDVITPGTSVNVGATAVKVKVAGISQVPATGAQAAVLGVTVTAPAAGGSLWAWQSGQPRPVSRVAGFGASRRTTSTAFVRLGSDGTITLQTSGPTVRVALDSIGYVTA